MASVATPSPAPAAAPVEQQQQEVQVSEPSTGLEPVMDGIDINANVNNGATESALHAACLEGKLEDVRAVLSNGLASLESLDANTGCTPIVLAIRGNHHDVVRELLSAGAIVPPPGLTNDPLMLSILYSHPSHQQMYGFPPQFMGMNMGMGMGMSMGMQMGMQVPNGHQDFYPQPNFYQQQQHQQPQPHLMSPNGQVNPNNLPPAEVSKTIPCRNFPNCKYGSSCVFFHPRQQQQQQQMYPASGPLPNGVVPNDGYSAPYPPPGQYYVPQNGHFSPTNGHFDHQQQQPESIPEQSTTQHDQTPAQQDTSAQAQAQIPSQHVPSAVAPVFIPGGFATQPIPDLITSPPPTQFGLSPLSPSMLGSSLPSIPPAEAFFAASPPNGFAPVPIPQQQQMNGHARRQSFNQQPQFAVPGKPFGHGKNPSFSGGPKWLGRPTMPNGSAKHGGWKGVNPPPCAFFAQGNCRNEEYCKFPHLDAEGNDSRHPDVVRGIIAPIPSLPRQPRGMRGMGPNFGPFDPAFRHQQHQHQLQFLQQQRMAAAQAQQGAAAPVAEQNGDAAIANGNGEVSDEVKANGDDTETSTAVPENETSEQVVSSAPVLPASVPPKPAAAPAPASATAAPQANIVRSASQPGIQRVHANGVASRSHSPAPSNVSFHGNGHPRRAGRVPQMNGHHPGANGHVNGNGNGNGRSASHGPAEKQRPSQRIPAAHEFPALGTPTTEKKDFISNGNGYSKVLSAPAPPPAPKAQPVVKVTSADGEDADAKSEKSDKQSVTMDSESESDAVIISTKTSGAGKKTSSTPTVNGDSDEGAKTPTPAAAPASAPETKRAPISFASVASAVSASAGIPSNIPSTSLEASPVALKA